MAMKHCLCRCVPKMEHTNVNSREPRMKIIGQPCRQCTIFSVVHLLLLNYGTIPYIVTNPCTIILVKNWLLSSGDGTGGPTKTMTGRSRSTLDMGFAKLVPGSNSTNWTPPLVKPAQMSGTPDSALLPNQATWSIYESQLFPHPCTH